MVELAHAEKASKKRALRALAVAINAKPRCTRGFAPLEIKTLDKLVHRIIQLIQLDTPASLSRRRPGSTFAVGTGFGRCDGIGMGNGACHCLMNRVNDSLH
jgi:hypothetical protein